MKLSILKLSPSRGKELTATNRPEAIDSPTDNQPVINETHQGHL
jgi:hypothetical protein